MVENSDTGKRKIPWLSILITAVISMVITFSVAWYQIDRTEKQEALANEERTRNVKENITAIVEEFILNSRPISLERLTRLINNRTKEGKIISAISLRDILESAEYNIIRSRYLDFERKSQYKTVFDTLYLKLAQRDFVPFEDVQYSVLANQLAEEIKKGSTAEALSSLTNLINSYNENKELRIKDSQKISMEQVFTILFKKPKFLVLFGAVYALFTVMLLRKRRIRKIIGSLFREALDR